MSNLNFISGRNFVTTDENTHKRKKVGYSNKAKGEDLFGGRPNINKETFKELPKYKDPQDFSSLKYELTNQHVYERMRDDYMDGKKITNKNYERTLFSKDIHVYNNYFNNMEDVAVERKAKKYSNLVQMAKDRVREAKIQRQERPKPIIKKATIEKKPTDDESINEEKPKQVKPKKKVAIVEDESQNEKRYNKNIKFAGGNEGPMDEPNLGIPKNSLLKYASNYPNPDDDDEDSIENYDGRNYAPNPEYDEDDDSDDDEEEENDEYDKPAFLNSENMALMKEIYADFEAIKQKKKKGSKDEKYWDPSSETQIMSETSKSNAMKQTNPSSIGSTSKGVGSQRTNLLKTQSEVVTSEQEIKTVKKEKENPTEILRRKVEECQQNQKKIQANVKKIGGNPADDAMGLDAELQNKVAKFRIQKGVVSKNNKKF